MDIGIMKNNALSGQKIDFLAIFFKTIQKINILSEQDYNLAKSIDEFIIKYQREINETICELETECEALMNLKSSLKKKMLAFQNKNDLTLDQEDY